VTVLQQADSSAVSKTQENKSTRYVTPLKLFSWAHVK